jgi:hypothetical protein
MVTGRATDPRSCSELAEGDSGASYGLGRGEWVRGKGETGETGRPRAFRSGRGHPDALRGAGASHGACAIGDGAMIERVVPDEWLVWWCRGTASAVTAESAAHQDGVASLRGTPMWYE